MNNDEVRSLSTLEARHHELDELLRKEELGLAPDQVRLTKLKREKLRLKDQIADLVHH